MNHIRIALFFVTASLFFMTGCGMTESGKGVDESGFAKTLSATLVDGWTSHKVPRYEEPRAGNAGVRKLIIKDEDGFAIEARVTCPEEGGKATPRELVSAARDSVAEYFIDAPKSYLSEVRTSPGGHPWAMGSYLHTTTIHTHGWLSGPFSERPVTEEHFIRRFVGYAEIPNTQGCPVEVFVDEYFVSINGESNGHDVEKLTHVFLTTLDSLVVLDVGSVMLAEPATPKKMRRNGDERRQYTVPGIPVPMGL